MTTPDTIVKTAWLALFAMALIIVAPLISVALQKDPMSAMPGMHHDMSMMSMAEMHHDAGSMSHGHHQEPPVVMPVDHAEACGYCVLLAHVPGVLLLALLLLCGRLPPVRTSPLRLTFHYWRFFPGLWPDTRAPPYLSAFYL